MHNKNLLLLLGLGLICIGFFKPNINLGVLSPINNVVNVQVDKPSDPALLDLAQTLTQSIKKANVSKEDCLRLASVCFDMSTLVGLDGSSEVIKNTEEIRQANKLSGLMLRMDMNKTYPGLADAMNKVVVDYIGDDIVVLNTDLRTKSVDVFQAIAWAFVEGSK